MANRFEPPDERPVRMWQLPNAFMTVQALHVAAVQTCFNRRPL